MLLELGQPRAEHPRVHHFGENGAAALLAYGARSNGVALCPLQPVGGHWLPAQLLELGQKSCAGNILLFRGSGDVGHKGARKLMLAVERVHGVGERLTVTQLIEETSAEAAADARDNPCGEPIGISARRTGECYHERSLRLVA